MPMDQVLRIERRLDAEDLLHQSFHTSERERCDSFYTYNVAWWTERLVQKLWVYVNGTARVSGCFYYNLNGQYIGSGSCSV